MMAVLGVSGTSSALPSRVSPTGAQKDGGGVHSVVLMLLLSAGVGR